MATVLALSLYVPIATLAVLYLRDQLVHAGVSLKETRGFLILAGAALIATGSAVFLCGFAYYFDFDQHYNPSGFFHAGGGIGLLGTLTLVLAMRHLRRPKRRR